MVARGEVWTLAGGGDYLAKPRPVVVVQDDRFDATESITICPCTTDEADLPLFRVPIEASEVNGLASSSKVMADKVASVRRRRLGSRLGRLTDEDLVRLNRALVVFLGLAESPRTTSRES